MYNSTQNDIIVYFFLYGVRLFTFDLKVYLVVWRVELTINTRDTVFTRELGKVERGEGEEKDTDTMTEGKKC